MIEAEKILENRNWIHECINQYISSPRKEKLLEFYLKYDDRLTIMAASHKKQYHNAFPGGYFDHVRRVIESALKINQVWVEMGVEFNYTIEELVFSALNHDLGKMGDEENESYLPQTDEWRKNKLEEDYMFNNKLEFMSVPDRSLFLLNSYGISYSKNEFLAIKLHDGLYDKSNEPYLLSWAPEQKPRTSLIFIVHQADLLSARIEWEKVYLKKFQETKVKEVKTKKISIKNKTLGTVQSSNLKNILDRL